LGVKEVELLVLRHKFEILRRPGAARDGIAACSEIR
jgi:hypothetical protein